jgi:hypothetical protein
VFINKKVQQTSDERNTPVPNFLIVGAGKSGTTSLYHYLSQHPEVFMSDPKEPRFLSIGEERTFNGPGDDISKKLSIDTFKDYCALFKNSGRYKARGEASVDYLFFHRHAIPNIKRYIGEPKILIILRNPVDRAYSAYTYLCRDGWENLSFAEALQQEEERKMLGYKWMWRYKEAGLYSEQVKAYLDNFSKVKIFLYEELLSNTQKLVKDIFSFLEVNPEFRPVITTRHNASGIPRHDLLNSLFVKPKRLHKVARTVGGFVIGKQRWVNLREKLRSRLLKKVDPLPADVAEELRNYYRCDIMKLQDITGHDLSHWLAGPQRHSLDQ